MSSLPRTLYASGGIYARAIFFAKAKNAHARLYHVISCEIHDIITSLSSLPRTLYASGGIYARAIFFAKAKNAHAQLYHAISCKIHDIMEKRSPFT